jgi:hypothetical protein
MPSEEFRAWWKKFRSTGDICPVRLGSTREDLRRIFGEPDDLGGISNKHTTPSIWKYGELEFHFGPLDSDVLVLIYSETPDGVVDVSIPMRCESAD